MSKNVGISRIRRNLIAIKKVEQNSDNKSVKKPLNKLFCDFDLTDVSIDCKINELNSNNTSFKFVKNIVNSNERNVCENNKNDNKLEPNIDNNESVGNTFKSINSLGRSQQNISNKRKTCSSLFDDLDLSDLDSHFETHFQTAQKAIKTTNECIETIETIDDNENNCQINSEKHFQNINQCSNGLSVLNVCSNSHSTNVFPNEEFSLDSQEDALFLSCAEDLEQTINLTKNSEKLELKKSTNNEMSAKCKPNNNEEEESDHELEMPFILRSDYYTYGEEDIENNSKCCLDYIEWTENPGFIGFRKGNGHLIHINESNRTKAQQLFHDIEKCLLKEINAIKQLNNSESSIIVDTNSQNSSNSFNCSNEENLFNGRMSSNSNAMPVEKEVIPTKSSPQIITSNQFKPLTCYPLNESNKDRMLFSSSLFDNSIKESMIPCTSTPKSSTFKRIKFEPKKSIPFVDKLKQIDCQNNL